MPGKPPPLISPAPGLGLENFRRGRQEGVLVGLIAGVFLVLGLQAVRGLL